MTQRSGNKTALPAVSKGTRSRIHKVGFGFVDVEVVEVVAPKCRVVGVDAVSRRPWLEKTSKIQNGVTRFYEHQLETLGTADSGSAIALPPCRRRPSYVG